MATLAGCSPDPLVKTHLVPGLFESLMVLKVERSGLDCHAAALLFEIASVINPLFFPLDID